MASTYEKSVKGNSEADRQFSRGGICWFFVTNTVLQEKLLIILIGATKVKMAAPKSKYIEHLLMATQVAFSRYRTYG